MVKKSLMKKLLFISLLSLFFHILFISPLLGYGHTVIIKVVRISPDWMPFASTDGWTQAVSVRESKSIKYFEIAIWEETSSIHLYEFPNDYDPIYGKDKTDQQKIAYREQFALLNFPGLPNQKEAKSNFVKESFRSILDLITSRYPHSNYGLRFNGQGRPDGTLFNGILAPKHSQDFLHNWTSKIQSKLAFIDMDGSGIKGGLSDLNTFCPFSEFYIASDISDSGYNFDNWTVEKHKETEPDLKFFELIEDNSTLKQVLTKRIDLKKKVYNYSRKNMTKNKIEQAIYLYSCTSFQKLNALLEKKDITLPPHYDLYSILVGYGRSYISAFNKTIIKSIDNRNFFHWETKANGILTPYPADFKKELRTSSYPIVSF